MTRQKQEGKSINAIEQLRAVAALYNIRESDAATDDVPLHERHIIGDATDQAVLRLSKSLGPIAELRKIWEEDV
jgi:sodium/potassium-transporting ATPase subunit alpha